MSNASSHAQAFNAGIVVTMDTTWQCNSCGQQHIEPARAEVTTPMHACGALAGAWVPFVPSNSSGHLRVQEREDYIGTDMPYYDANGRVLMSVYVERDDGEDCFILAPTATSIGTASSLPQ